MDGGCLFSLCRIIILTSWNPRNFYSRGLHNSARSLYSSSHDHWVRTPSPLSHGSRPRTHKS